MILAGRFFRTKRCFRASRQRRRHFPKAHRPFIQTGQGLFSRLSRVRIAIADCGFLGGIDKVAHKREDSYAYKTRPEQARFHESNRPRTDGRTSGD